MYKYECLTYRAGALVARRHLTMTGVELATVEGRVGGAAFLSLINRWNAQNKDNPSDIINLYIAEVVG